MKIINVQQKLSKAAQNVGIGQKQQAAMDSAISLLKGKIPEIVPMLSNPTFRTFLMKFLDMVTTDPSILNNFKNSLQIINSAMKADLAETTTMINSSTK